MSWVKIDDQLVDNRKIDRLSDRAFRLYMAGLCFCGATRNDGYLLAKDVRVVAAKVRATKKQIDELIDGELWLPLGGGGFQVKDFLDYNPSQDELKEKREADRKRQAARRTRARHGVTDGVTPPVTHGVSHASPVPSRKDQKTLGELGLFVVPDSVKPALTEAS